MTTPEQKKIMITPDLLPCPFCGSTDIRKTDNGHCEWLYCAECDCKGPWIEPPEGHCFSGTEMADQWNTRVSQPTEDAVERVDPWALAQKLYAAHCVHHGHGDGSRWNDEPYQSRESWANVARAAIQALPDEGLREALEELRPLVEKAMPMFPITTHDTPDYAEVHFGEGDGHSSQAMTMNPDHWQALNQLFVRVQALSYSDKLGGGE